MNSYKLVMQLHGKEWDSIHVYRISSGDFELHTRKTAMEWSDKSSFKEYMSNYSEQREKGNVVCSDVWDGFVITCKDLQEVIEKIRQEISPLTQLELFVLIEEYKEPLKKLVDLSSENGKYKSSWQKKLFD